MHRKDLDYYLLFSGDEEDYILFKRFIAYMNISIKHHKLFYLKKQESIPEIIFSSVDTAVTQNWNDLESTLPLIDQIENIHLIRALLSLAVIEQQIINDFIYFEKSFLEISNSMDLPVRKVRSIYYNTIRKLRRNLEAKDEFFL